MSEEKRDQKDGGPKGKDEAEREDSHRMVKIGSHPEPFATHAPPPEEKTPKTPKTPKEPKESKEPKTGGWDTVKDTLTEGERVSVAFVLGVLIVAAVLFIGLMFASQRRRIGELTERIERIETLVEMQGEE